MGNHSACQRLAFEELVAHQISLQRVRKAMQSRPGYPIKIDGIMTQQLKQQLPFKLTSAQQKVLTEITADLQQDRPMLRLVQGDVGSGKTIVSALAVLQAIEAGYQAAVMAPTELLAEQHYDNFNNWFNQLGIKVGWLAGSVTGKERDKTT